MFNLQNKYQNETIYVLGLGPSLNYKICKELKEKNCITIGVNQIYRMIVPTYHLHADYNWKKSIGSFSSRSRKHLEKLIEHGTELIAPLDHGLKPTTDLPHQAFYSCGETSFTTCYQESIGVLRLGHSSTSIYHALQLAVIMGANKIVLIGVDFYIETDNKGVGKMHCYDHETKIPQRDKDRICNGLIKLERDIERRDVLSTLKKRKVQVLNASKKSKLKVFKKVKLSEVL